jgi:hypothetical protein
MKKYNIGDMLIIPRAEKIGIIIDTDYKHRRYRLFWQFSSGITYTVWEIETTIDNWLSKTIGMGKDNKNQHFPVPNGKSI